MTLLGIHEINGIDTELGADTCRKVAAILRALGYRAEYKTLKNEFDCDIALSMHVHKQLGGIQVTVSFGDSGYGCEALIMNDEKLGKWVEQCARYFTGLELFSGPEPRTT